MTKREISQFITPILSCNSITPKIAKASDFNFR